jgi:hypothetical protein
MPRLKRVDVRKKGGERVATSANESLLTASTKVNAVRMTVALIKRKGEPTTMRIYRTNGASKRSARTHARPIPVAAKADPQAAEAHPRSSRSSSASESVDQSCASSSSTAP